MASASEVEPSNSYDYLVIGGGSGGIASARRAAQWGAKVGVIERKGLGGTCVNVGCVPKKVMFNAATINEMMHASKHYCYTGVEEGSEFNWKKLKTLRDNYIKRLHKIYESNLEGNGVEIISGTAEFVDQNTLKVNEKIYNSKHFLIATGGSPRMPDIPGIEHCINSDGFFNLDSKPKKVAVVGAGYIGVELAGIFNALDVDTTLFIRGEKPLPRFDTLLVDTLETEMKRQNLNLIPDANVNGVCKNQDNSLSIELEGGQVHHGFDQVLMAVGRTPLVDNMNIEAINLATKSGDFIDVDQFQNTNVPGVYALGDVCGQVQLTPMAVHAGRRLSDRLFGNLPEAKADYECCPTVVFSHPTIGTIGMTEADARSKYGDKNVRIYQSKFVNLFYGPWETAVEDKPKTAMKLVCLGEDEKVIGLHCIGMGTDEMLQGFAVAIKAGATKADFDRTLAIHPTASEEFVTMAPWGLHDNASPAQAHLNKEKLK